MSHILNSADFPPWLQALANASLVLGLFCALVIAIDEYDHPQKMWIMNLVWPLTTSFGSLFWLAAYYAWGRNDAGKSQEKPSFPVMVFKGTSHCGAGCTVGDIVVEWLAVAVPPLAVWFGWGSVFGEKTFALWIPDFIVAFLFGILFQYFTIKPMRNLSIAGGIAAAIKADIASISVWQIGMYGAMALIQFVWFRSAFGGIAAVTSAQFWFAMQLAMLGGFLTSFPVNWWLIRSGLKEKM